LDDAGATPAAAGAIFQLEKGQVSEVIETPMGYQIVKIEDTKRRKLRR
jgi:parvulin-like peptidyl-prolyl isomerase